MTKKEVVAIKELKYRTVELEIEGLTPLIELSWFKKKYKGLQELSKIMQDIEELEAQR